MVVTHRQLTILKTHSHGESVYERFVRTTFKKAPVNTEVLNLPTWVPDWRKSVLNSNTTQSHSWLNQIHQGKQPVFNDEEFGALVKFSDDSRRLSVNGMRVGQISTVYKGGTFPYPVKSDDQSFANLTCTERFANFLGLAGHGRDVISQYFRFVFRSAEGTTNRLFEYETDLSDPIHTMIFRENGNITMDLEGALGCQLINFLVNLIGEENLSGVPASGNNVQENSTVPAFPADDKAALCTWWGAITGAFDIDTWPDSFKDKLKARAGGAHMDEEGRAESMQEIKAWIGTKSFNFFIIPGFGLGACPDCIKVEDGDFVFRPAAHDGPIILRPVGDGTFKNVGECFVSHTLIRAMDNEETLRSMRHLYKWVDIV
jgi:hypothetical protein